MRKSLAPSRKGFQSPTLGNNLQKNLQSIKRNVGEKPKKLNSTTNAIIELLEQSKSSSDVPIKDSSPSIENIENVQEEVVTNKKIYKIVWGKKSTKKHKTWQGDGFLEVGERSATCKDDGGNYIGRITNLKSNEFEDGQILSIGGKDVQIVELISTNPTPRLETSAKSENNLKRKPEANKLFRLTRKKVKLTETEYEPLFMPPPPPEHQWLKNENNLSVQEVEVDAFLARVLRPHQRLGVMFLYKCVLGFYSTKEDNYEGAILADEMGLGKTLQCITLIWTLLKKGPYGGVPVIRRVLIVTPSSLVGNWEKEFYSWLGKERIKVFTIDNKNKPKDYVKLEHIPIMIISYEMFVRHFDDIKNIKFDLLVCDEGHRLKNSSIKATISLNELPCSRRIILTGTPIQNDLQEFYVLSNFVNPGILGQANEYRHYYQNVIVESREPNADTDLKELGESRALELNQRTNNFILRRTQDINAKYLPSKQELVVFCKVSDLQQRLYEAAVDFWESRCVLNSISIKSDVTHLSVITALKKICNHPSLLTQNSTNDEENSTIIDHLLNLLPEWDEMAVSDSYKLQLVEDILKVALDANERVILVSYFTQTLDMFSGLCDHNGYKYCRLDGSTPTSQRTEIVARFNDLSSDNFVFLLSARAGGVGLNLTGASKLVLFDSDWNPATDLQAMSRIWRDGQKNNNVYIYRLLTAGTIEEKIFQRQISKTGLSSAVVDPNNATHGIKFSMEELKDLFTLHYDIDSLTHQMLNCSCSGDGSIPVVNEEVSREDDEIRDCQLGVTESSDQGLRMNELGRWEHHAAPFDSDKLLEMALNTSESITFIFRNKCKI